jgi:hypothetical protein
MAIQDLLLGLLVPCAMRLIASGWALEFRLYHLEHEQARNNCDAVVEQANELLKQEDMVGFTFNNVSVAMCHRFCFLLKEFIADLDYPSSVSGSYRTIRLAACAAAVVMISSALVLSPIYLSGAD